MGSADVIPVRFPHGWDEIIEVYGDPKVRAEGDGFTVDSKWERENMDLLDHPFIPNTRRQLYCHRKFKPYLAQLLDAWSARVDAGDPYRLKKLACFNPRLMRGSTSLYSTHSLGIAVDANPDQNPLVLNCRPDDPRRRVGPFRDIPDAWLDDARRIGLTCGADFSARSDPQHIQACSGY